MSKRATESESTSEILQQLVKHATSELMVPYGPPPRISSKLTKPLSFVEQVLYDPELWILAEELSKDYYSALPSQEPLDEGVKRGLFNEFAAYQYLIRTERFPVLPSLSACIVIQSIYPRSIINESTYGQVSLADPHLPKDHAPLPSPDAAIAGINDDITLVETSLQDNYENIRNKARQYQGFINDLADLNMSKLINPQNPVCLFLVPSDLFENYAVRWQAELDSTFERTPDGQSILKIEPLPYPRIEVDDAVKRFITPDKTTAETDALQGRSRFYKRPITA